MYILSIDLGTSAAKVALVGESGDLAAATSRPLRTQELPPDGFEQDAEESWTAVLGAAEEVLSEAGVDRFAVGGISCSAQYCSIVPVDRELRPLHNMVLWMDGRAAAQSLQLYARVPDVLAQWSEIHGLVPLPTGNDSLSHMLWFGDQRPDVHARTYKYLEPVDFLVARLSGECVSNACAAFPLLLTDNRDLSLRTYSPELVALSGIATDKLPPLCPIGARVGTLRRRLAAELGLPPSTPVFAGVNDTQAAAVGTATFQGNHGGVNLGTSSQVLAHLGGKKSDLGRALVSMPSPIAGRHMVMAENGLGGKPLDHFLRNVAFASDPLADHGGESADGGMFAGVDRAAELVPPGSEGVLFLPWLTGAQTPVMHAATRGGFMNLGLHTTRAHMLRAILEGVAFNMRWALPSVEEFVGRRFAELLFAGGGAVSDAWAQILADVTDRPVGQLGEPRYVNNRATAFLALVELGILGLEDVGRICRVRRQYAPRAQHRGMYDDRFVRFVAAFERLQPVYEALNG